MRGGNEPFAMRLHQNPSGGGEGGNDASPYPLF